MATSGLGAAAALPPYTPTSTAAGLDGASSAADKVLISDFSTPTFAGLLANAGAGSSFDAMAPAVTPFGHSPSEVDPLDGGLPIRQGGGSIAFTPPITEPQTYAMLLAALGVVGFVARHRRGTTVR
jgi:hypothetical protein